MERLGNKMEKIYPCLWLDNQAQEAAKFYTTVFEKGAINDTQYYLDDLHKPKGSVLTVDLTLANQRFILLNGGSDFKITPAISFFVDCETKEELEALWHALLEGGFALMPLQTYPFSEYFGWVQDRFGVTWQLALSNIPQRISPAVMFANEKFGQAKQAMTQWLSLFPRSEILLEVPDGENLQQALFTLNDMPFRVMDSPGKHDFGFTMGISFCVDCEDQAEIDYLWENLTQDGKEWDCGWLEDRYGVAWQIEPANWVHLVDTSHPERAQAVTNELYKMKKIDIARLEAVYNQFTEDNGST